MDEIPAARHFRHRARTLLPEGRIEEPDHEAARTHAMLAARTEGVGQGTARPGAPRRQRKAHEFLAGHGNCSFPALENVAHGLLPVRKGGGPP